MFINCRMYESLYDSVIESWKIENDLYKKETADFGYTTKSLYQPEVIQVENDSC